MSLRVHLSSRRKLSRRAEAAKRVHRALLLIAKGGNGDYFNWVARSSFRKLPEAALGGPGAKTGGGTPAVKDVPKPKSLYDKPGEELVELFNGFLGVTS